MLRQITIALSVGLTLIVGLVFKPEFFDPLSLALTLGGAALVTYLSYTREQLLGLWQALHELFAGTESTAIEHGQELRRLSELFHLHGIRGLESQEPHLKDRFTRFGVMLLVDMNNFEHIAMRLEQRRAFDAAQSEINRQILATLAKLLPSFGLIGTLIGMVQLLASLSHMDGKALPAALGLAVLTTLYGAVMANVIVAPLMARLHSLATERAANMMLTRDWVLGIARGEMMKVAESRKWSPSRREIELTTVTEWRPSALPAQN